MLLLGWASREEPSFDHAPAAAAHAFLETGSHTGKFVLAV
jgi:NADPH:quinone reductase-like Zn-dependent oxidoreductase